MCYLVCKQVCTHNAFRSKVLRTRASNSEILVKCAETRYPTARVVASSESSAVFCSLFFLRLAQQYIGLLLVNVFEVRPSWLLISHQWRVRIVPAAVA